MSALGPCGNASLFKVHVPQTPANSGIVTFALAFAGAMHGCATADNRRSLVPSKSLLLSPAFASRLAPFFCCLVVLNYLAGAFVTEQDRGFLIFYFILGAVVWAAIARRGYTLAMNVQTWASDMEPEFDTDLGVTSGQAKSMYDEL